MGGNNELQPDDVAPPKDQRAPGRNLFFPRTLCFEDTLLPPFQI